MLYIGKGVGLVRLARDGCLSNLASLRNIRIYHKEEKMIEDALLILFISFCTASVSEGTSSLACDALDALL